MSKSSHEVSVIVTILNEAESIGSLIESLASQTLKPAAVVIVDGGSSDNTETVVNTYIKKYTNIKIIFAVKVGNRSVGRNFAVRKTETQLIACTDAGCIPEKNWLEELLRTYTLDKKPVVAGYYRGIYTDSFEKAVIPYALVMPDQVNPQKFLPATRSLLFEKRIWAEVGGFDEKLSDNEDYAFAKLLEWKNIPISFARDAVVAWQPRKKLYDFYRMIFRFARGDIQAKIIRPKVVLLFMRYFIALVFCVVLASHELQSAFIFITISFILYSAWAVLKNVRYVGGAWYWLPILQFTADVAVMWGSVLGLKNLFFESK